MKNIEVKVLNPEVITECEKMMVTGARLTQRGHSIKSLDDFMELYNKPYKAGTARTMYNLPHPTIQKLGVINVVVVGASRRFLAQITRHQNEIKFVSASLQYSDYSDDAAFVVPYAILNCGQDAIDCYLETCKSSMKTYKGLVSNLSVDNDSAGYAAPQGLRNVLIMSATPFQWKHMIKQRTCNRNTKETQYVMLKIWEALYEINPNMFANAGPFCTVGKCMEGLMCCKRPVPKTPQEVLKQEFPLFYSADPAKYKQMSIFNEEKEI